MICCADLHVDELIKQFATAKHDSKILFITSEKLLVKKPNIIPYFIRTIHVLRKN